MDKTININIAGTLFKIDEEAFRILRDYLQAINNRFRNVQGGHETIDDIEFRIAEIFQSQRGVAGVISKDNVEAMIAIIGKPEDFDHSETGTESPLYTSRRKRMYRNPDDSIVSGVCGGIGAYLNTDPVLFRILFVIFALFFGVGFFVYIALWIALPSALTDTQKREMFGGAYHSTGSHNRQPDNIYVSSAPLYNSGYNNTSRVGNAFNEIFRAIGRVCYIILRIFLIIIGVLLVLTGFLFILSFVMVFVFKYPGAFSIDSSGINLNYFPDFLNYLVNPATVPWIIILSSIAFIIPMLALIYWGVKMIFWFNSRDGVVSLVGLVLWVITIAALAVILFTEGISFAQTGKTTVETVLTKSPDTLYVVTDHKIADLKFDKQISLPHEEYTVLINDQKKELYIRPYLTVTASHDLQTRVEVRRQSTGRNEMEASAKAGGLLYNYSLKNDSLNIDEYFTLPAGRKWSADNIGIHLYIPSGTILKFDEASRIMAHSRYRDRSDEYVQSRWKPGIGCWEMTDEGLEPATKIAVNQK